MSLLLCLIVAICARNVHIEAIAGGSFISIKEAPYYVGQYFFGRSFCGGAIISEYWVLTAAHCVGKLRFVLIDTGGGIADKQANTFSIEKIIVHGSYEELLHTYYVLDNDIALIKLHKAISFNEYQQPIKIRAKPPKVGDEIIVSGLGDQGNARDAPKVLKMTTMRVVSCGDETTGNFFCGSAYGTLSCQGDSGSPVVIEGELAGVVSHGTGCDGLVPGDGLDAYTRVDLYRDWIAKHTGIKMDK